jgi:hypothetical protein
MFAFLLIIGRWIAKRLLWLLVITAVLWAGWQISNQLATLKSKEASVPYLEQGAQSLIVDIKEQAARAEQSVGKLKGASLEKLDDRILELSKQIHAKLGSLEQLDSIINRINPAKILDSARLKAELEIASQERAYLLQVKSIHAKANATVQIAGMCEAIRQKHIAAFDVYQSTDANLKKARIQAGLLAQWIPISGAYNRVQSLENERTNYAKQTRLLKQEYDACLVQHRSSQQAYLQAKTTRDFAFDYSRTQAVVNELQAETGKIREEVEEHWIKQILTDPVKEVLPIAFGILALAIVVPIAIKLCLFFVLAPMASRQRAISLLPGSASHYSMPEQRQSAVSLTVSLPADSELVVKPAYFHSASVFCKTASRIGLNRRFLFTSIAAGMYNLTQVSCDKPASVTLSAGHDALNELAILRVAEGESVSIRPKNMVGVIHPRNKLVSLSSHWRLGSLQAWLSMQLRYLVFHGPVDIIIKGSRGVRVENAAHGRMIDQGSTIGFSANLDYGVCRTETFMAYLTGEKELLRDRFSGASGFYIYEEMPNGGRKPGVKRGIEGLMDSILKVFGI